MKTEYVLIDYENIQPEYFDALKAGQFKILIFVGPHQTKIPIEMATALQSLGEKVEYVRLEKDGKNALDFHIAYYLGILSQQGPARFHIISKDAGFDPLIHHVSTKGGFAKRYTKLADIPVKKKTAVHAADTSIDRVLKDLRARKTSKPGSAKSLRSTIHAIFKKELSEKELDHLIAELEKRGIIKIEASRVTYELPEE